MLINHEQILQETCKTKGVPYEKVRTIMTDFFQQLVMHLQHPESNFLRGIIIENSIKFELNPKQVMRAYLRLYKANRLSSVYSDNLRLLNQQLLQYDIYTKAQKEIITDNERNRIQETGGEGDSPDEEG